MANNNTDRKKRNAITRIAHDIKKIASEHDKQVAWITPDNLNDGIYVKFHSKGNKYNGIPMIIKIRFNYGTGSDTYHYPMNPPKFEIVAPKVWHPNINNSGSVCVDFLTDESAWKETMDLSGLINMFENLLEVNANPESPYNVIAARAWNLAVESGNWTDYIENVNKLTIGNINTYLDYFKNGSPNLIENTQSEDKPKTIVKRNRREEIEEQKKLLALKKANLLSKTESKTE
jgi:ubiquitin-protein ligase